MPSGSNPFYPALPYTVTESRESARRYDTAELWKMPAVKSIVQPANYDSPLVEPLDNLPTETWRYAVPKW